MKIKIMKLFFAGILLFYWGNTAEAQQSLPFNVSYSQSVPYLTPGDRNIGLEFTVQNNKDITISNMRVYLFLKYPFSASIPPNNNLGEITYPGYLISSGGSGDEYTQFFNLGPASAHKTFFRIDVDRGAKRGIYDIPYTIYYENGEYSDKITVAVMGDTLIEIKDVRVVSNNSQVEPGEVFKIAISLENIGDNSIKWLKLTLTPRDKSLVPVSSDSERIFKDIPQGAIKETEMWFSIDRDATARNYPVDLSLDYMDERGVEYNETKLVGIVSAGRAALDIAKKTTQPARIIENEPFTLTVKIENTGTGSAKGVTARLESEIGGDTLAYLGEIKKDDYSNAVFTLDAAKTGTRKGILHITYDDDFGKHEMDKELILVVSNGSTVNPLPVIIIAVVVIAGIIYWMRRKH